MRLFLFPQSPFKILFLALVVFLVPILAGAETAAETAISGTKDGVAIDGYDPVAYFTLGKPTRGTEQFSYMWQGANWRFVSAENRDAFAAKPELYTPQYGGYCAYAMAGGAFAAGDGERWKIVDNKLYLNNNWLAQKLWSGDIRGYISNADRQWPKVNPAEGKPLMETAKP